MLYFLIIHNKSANTYNADIQTNEYTTRLMMLMSPNIAATKSKLKNQTNHRFNHHTIIKTNHKI